MKKELIILANKLDLAGHFEAADKVDVLLRKIAIPLEIMHPSSGGGGDDLAGETARYVGDISGTEELIRDILIGSIPVIGTGIDVIKLAFSINQLNNELEKENPDEEEIKSLKYDIGINGGLMTLSVLAPVAFSKLLNKVNPKTAKHLDDISGSSNPKPKSPDSGGGGQHYNTLKGTKGYGFNKKTVDRYELSLDTILDPNYGRDLRNARKLALTEYGIPDPEDAAAFVHGFASQPLNARQTKALGKSLGQKWETISSNPAAHHANAQGGQALEDYKKWQRIAKRENDQIRKELDEIEDYFEALKDSGKDLLTPDLENKLRMAREINESARLDILDHMSGNREIPAFLGNPRSFLSSPQATKPLMLEEGKPVPDLFEMPNKTKTEIKIER